MRVPRPRIRRAVSLALAAAAIVAGCGGSDDGGSEPAPPPADPEAPVSGTLRTFTYSDTASDVILDPFRKQNPDLDLQTATFDSVQEGAAKLAGGFEADVVNVCSDEYQPLITRGLLRPIDPAAIEGWDELAFRDNEGVERPDGNVNFVPVAAGPQGLLYNTEEVVPPPDSWADLFDPAYAGRVSIDGGTWLTPIAETAAALGAENPMVLTDEQVEEAKQKLIDSKSQFRAFTGSDSEKLNLFKGGEIVLADGGRYNALLLQAEGEPVEWVAPEGGAALVGLRPRDHLEGGEHRRRLQADQLLRLEAGAGDRRPERLRGRQPGGGRRRPRQVPRDRRPALDRRRDRRGPARQLRDLGSRLAGGAERLSADPAAVAEARDLLAELVGIPSPSGAEGRVVDRIEALCADWSLPVRRGPQRDRSRQPRGRRRRGARARLRRPRRHDRRPVAGARGGRRRHRPRPRLGRRQGRRGRLPASRPGRWSRPARTSTAWGSRSRSRSTRSAGAAARGPSRSSSRPSGRSRSRRPGCARGSPRPATSTPGSTSAGARPTAALTDAGENAIDAAVALIGALPRLGLDAHTHPLLGASQAEVGAIRGGTDFNTVPDLCSFQLQTRIVPGQDGDAHAGGARGARGRVTAATVELVEMTEPFETPDDSPLVAALAELTAEVAGEPREPIGVPAWTDAHNMVDFGGAEAVVYGPGDFRVAHLPTEHIDVNEVVECAEVFTRLARRAAGW